MSHELQRLLVTGHFALQFQYIVVLTGHVWSGELAPNENLAQGNKVVIGASKNPNEIMHKSVEWSGQAGFDGKAKCSLGGRRSFVPDGLRRQHGRWLVEPAQVFAPCR